MPTDTNFTDAQVKRLQDAFSQYHSDRSDENALPLVAQIYELKKAAVEVYRETVGRLAAEGILTFDQYHLPELVAAVRDRRAALQRDGTEANALALIGAVQALELVTERLYGASAAKHEAVRDAREFTATGWKPVDTGRGKVKGTGNPKGP